MESKETYSVSELIDMARALSEGEFDEQFKQHFQGELGQLATHMESLRQNLKSLSPGVGTSAHLIPEASKGVAEISKQAEISVISIMDLVDEMSADQEKVVPIIEGLARGESSDFSQLRKIADKSRRSLVTLLSYLSFQDVLRQRAEKIQENMDTIEKKILELLVKFKIKVNEQVIKDGDGREIMREQVKDLSESKGLDQALVDDLLENL